MKELLDEMGNLEDHYSGHRKHSDGGTDRTGHHVVHGPWPNLHVRRKK